MAGGSSAGGERHAGQGGGYPGDGRADFRGLVWVLAAGGEEGGLDSTGRQHHKAIDRVASHFLLTFE